MILLTIEKKLKGAEGDFTLNIDENIVKGDFIGIYGKSGIGKTTLLQMLSGLEKPTNGRIVVDGEIWFDSSKKINIPVQKRSIGYVFQNDVLFPNMTVLQNLRFALTAHQKKYFLEELIEVMELKALLNFNSQQLSGGQKQRVSLARALVQKPKLLLLDEPLSALDIEMRQRLQQFIAKVHKKYQLTILIVSHDPLELYQLVGNVWQLNNGTISAKGTPKEVLPLDLYRL
ncbi:ATP-binding cassette domain-containing protein [Aquimarina agarivorans]|uniref:ATP-binding cassette domain-containing protein n=1 Tax=Aquimarina agarivorans TaxID=980584 RepID=UPI000248E795|nr:ATP-binding cassette domain-containing protein [Aquimarina agarivorans]